ncbi:MAG: TonB-dependent receptor [Flavobacterium sp.]|nr:TonB-dependent receptor [Flavobacterium sp.]
MKVFYTLLLLVSTNFLFAQNAVITGTVLDDTNGSTLPGVDVVIKSINASATTGADGKYIFRNLAAGSYLVEFSFTGYDSKEVSEVIAKDNEITDLNITLVGAKKNQLQEVVITRTKAKAESVKSLLTLQKNNSSVSDGISAETIKRTPDKTTSDVLKRISGASIQDNRFVIVRGLNDRYNAAFLNGAPLPSSEPDRKAFSFDVFPSNMLDNLVITKTASPDMPGDFAGGIIQINTKAVPDKNFQSLTIGSGVNTITTFNNQKTYQKSSTDWIGYDDGLRSLPATMPSTDAFNALSYQEKAAIAKTFNSDFKISDARFKPNTNFQYTFGHHFDVKDKVIGLLISVSNSLTNNYNETTRSEYETNPLLPSFLSQKFFDKNYSEQVLTSMLGNVSLKFNENHNITFKNIFSINSTDLVVDRFGQRDTNETRHISASVRWFTSNQVYSGQLNGDHYFSAPKIKINWTGFYSKISRSIPNLRRNIYGIADPYSNDPSQTIPIAEIAANNGGPDYGGGMFFSENDESITGGKLDISKKFSFSEDFTNEIKLGVFTQNRDRDFFARQLQYNTLNLGGTFNQSLLTLSDDLIFNPSNMGVISPGVNGFTLFELTKYYDNYSAGSKLNAAYIMLDNRFKKFRLVWGVRVEDFTQTLNSRLTDVDYLNLNTNKIDFLPSANLIYSINKSQNLRLSYSKTLNRPEYRELAPFGFYDFTNQFFTQGNADLKRATVENYDLRYEIYPSKGQMFTVSYFMKNFKDPIEVIQQVNNRTISYQNAKSAVNSGIEMEFRMVLSSLFNGEKAPFLEDMTWFSNVAVIKSVVDVSNVNAANPEAERTMQGQSPYLFNSGLQYMNKENGLVLSANINKAGNRIAYGSSEARPAIWEKGRAFLDMQIAKSFYNNKLELKLNIQNILAEDLIFYQNNYKNSTNYGTVETLGNYIFTGDYHYQDGFNATDDDIIWQTNFGRSFSLSATFNF